MVGEAKTARPPPKDGNHRARLHSKLLEDLRYEKHRAKDIRNRKATGAATKPSRGEGCMSPAPHR
eukprot:9715246-Alexandrium_andersonii.AAC.1